MKALYRNCTNLWNCSTVLCIRGKVTVGCIFFIKFKQNMWFVDQVGSSGKSYLAHLLYFF